MTHTTDKNRTWSLIPDNPFTLEEIEDAALSHYADKWDEARELWDEYGPDMSLAAKILYTTAALLAFDPEKVEAYMRKEEYWEDWKSFQLPTISPAIVKELEGAYTLDLWDRWFNAWYVSPEEDLDEEEHEEIGFETFSFGLEIMFLNAGLQKAGLFSPHLSDLAVAVYLDLTGRSPELLVDAKNLIIALDSLLQRDLPKYYSLPIRLVERGVKKLENLARFIGSPHRPACSTQP